MGEHSTRLSGVSVAPRLGFGFITDGQLLNFNSAFPHGTTRLVGGEVDLDFQRIEAGQDPKAVGQLALLYYWGHATDSFSQDDLPFGNDPILNLIQFKGERESNSHFILTEWRWPSFAPLYQSKRWTFIHPQFGLGLGGFYINTRVSEENGGTKTVEKGGFLVTGSTQVRVMAVKAHNWEFSIEASVRMFAGQAFGILGEAGLRVTRAW